MRKLLQNNLISTTHAEVCFFIVHPYLNICIIKKDQMFGSLLFNYFKA